MVSALHAHLARLAQECLGLGQRCCEQEQTIPSAVDTPLDPLNVARRHWRVLGQAKLPDVRSHDLRHSCATLLVALGAVRT